MKQKNTLNLIRTSLSIDQDLYFEVRKKLLGQRMSFSEWLRQKMREELRDEKIIESGKTQMDMSVIKQAQ